MYGSDTKNQSSITYPSPKTNNGFAIFLQLMSPEIIFVLNVRWQNHFLGGSIEILQIDCFALKNCIWYSFHPYDQIK